MDRIVDLSGTWDIRQVDGTVRLKGSVPGLVHHDLLKLGRLPDPFFRMNEKDQQWVGASTWEYTRTFELTAVQTDRRSVVLDCEGLDTLAEIWVNGHSVAATDNMFLRYRFDIKPLVRGGSNSIRIVFYPAAPEMQKRADSYTHELGGFRHADWEPKNRNYLRKAHTHGGWDWGPCFLTQGPYRPIRVECRDGARILSLMHQQEHSEGSVTLRVKARIESPATQYGQVLFSISGNTVALTVPFKPGVNVVEETIRISNPVLWWPNGMGQPVLHDLSCSVLCAGETDSFHQKIGLRKLEVVREKDKWGESFFFRVNGVPMFAKGADWIPGDNFDSRLSDDRIRQDLVSSADARFNMLRLWGGGLYERDFFYHECDRLGLLLWHDFMFACHLYPTNPQFLASVRDEVRYQIRRLQHHPSIALWCGNNENEMAVSWHTSGDRERLKTLLIAEYDQLYIQTIAPIVAEEDPDRVYWPSSPSNGIRKYEDPNDMSRGDVHFWDVWHGDKPYEHYETVIPRFCSEFGFQSFPAPETMALCTDPSDRNLTSPVAEFHQRSGQGNQRILKHISIHFRMPYTWEDTLYMSQVHQAEAIRVAVEHWRRNKPRNMGVIVWQLNDIWPVASWASLDSTGRWKLLQYLEKRAFAPLMVSAGFKEGKASVWGVSDINSPVSGTLTIRLRSVSTGKTLKTLTRKVALKPLESRKIYSFEPGTLLKSVPEWTGEVCAELSLVCGKSISRNVLFFDEYKRLNLQDPGLKWSLDKKGCLTVSCRRPALFVTANTGAANGSWEDNGVHLFPGQSLKVRFRSWPRDDRKALTALRKGLKLTDLWTATTDQKAR